MESTSAEVSPRAILSTPPLRPGSEPSLMRRTSVLVLLSAPIISCIILWLRGAFGPNDPRPSREVAPADLARAISQATGDGERVLSQALTALEASSTKSEQPSKVATPPSARDRDGCEWGQQKVSAADLAGEFLMPPVTLEQIVRHKTLNAADTPLCPWSWSHSK